MTQRFNRLVEMVEGLEETSAMQRTRPYSRHEYVEVRYADERREYVVEYDARTHQAELVQRVGTRRTFRA